MPSDTTIHPLKSSTMPKIKLTTQLPATPWTKVPNALLGHWLPKLKDTELRVLLVLIRQTTGWKQEGQEVRLTYRSLMAKTGRKSEAISAALASLQAQRLIHISETKLHKSYWISKQGSPEIEDVI